MLLFIVRLRRREEVVVGAGFVLRRVVAFVGMGVMIIGESVVEKWESWNA